jgi:hypothetical protein
MAKFLFVYHSCYDTKERLPPQEREAGMQRWRAWLGEGFQKGWLVDAGDALKRERRFLNAKMIVSDGPFAESKEVIGGFSIVQAETLDEAAELAKGCPALLYGGTVEVGPLEGFTINK